MKIRILTLFEAIFLLLLATLSALYTGEVKQFCSVAGFYLLGRIFIRYILHGTEDIVVHIYRSGFILFGFYMLLTHAICITDPFTTYFFHNDASDAFYYWTIYFAHYPWDEMISKVLTSYFFSAYPGAGTWFVSLAKIAQDCGIDNTRFFLRLQSVMVGASILGIMAKCLLTCCVDEKRTVRQLIYFMLFSYLFICSVIFTRDILVAFFYTYLGYLFIRPQCPQRIPKMLVIVVLAGLMRPMNGLFAILFVLGYIYWENRNTHRYASLLLIVGLLVIVATTLVDLFTQSLESILFYQARNTIVSEGIFSKIYSLPFPVNILFVIVYSMLLPFPMNHHIVIGLEEGGGWVTFPTLVEPFYWSFILICVLAIVYRMRHTGNIIVPLCFLAFLFIAITEGMESNVRRTFAIYPTLSMVYIIYRQELPDAFVHNVKQYWWSVLMLLNIVAMIYVGGR